MDNSSCVWSREASFMTAPNEADRDFARAVQVAPPTWVAGAADLRSATIALLAGSAQRRAVALHGWTGRAVRPSAEHGRPEVRLIFSQAPVCLPQRHATACSPRTVRAELRLAVWRVSWVAGVRAFVPTAHCPGPA